MVSSLETSSQLVSFYGSCQLFAHAIISFHCIMNKAVHFCLLVLYNTCSCLCWHFAETLNKAADPIFVFMGDESVGWENYSLSFPVAISAIYKECTRINYEAVP